MLDHLMLMFLSDIPNEIRLWRTLFYCVLIIITYHSLIMLWRVLFSCVLMIIIHHFFIDLEHTTDRYVKAEGKKDSVDSHVCSFECLR